jgi:hypothetical protein
MENLLAVRVPSVEQAAFRERERIGGSSELRWRRSMPTKQAPRRVFGYSV